MTEEQFWDSTPRSFHHRITGFYELENQRNRQAWERTRWLAAILLQPHARKGKTIRPTDLLKFQDESTTTTTLKAGPITKDPARKKIYREMMLKMGIPIPIKYEA